MSLLLVRLVQRGQFRVQAAGFDPKQASDRKRKVTEIGRNAAIGNAVGIPLGESRWVLL